MKTHPRKVATHLGEVPVIDTHPRGGGGSVLFLLHGFLCNHSFWPHLINVLPPDLRVIAPDLTAFGRTGPGSREIDFNHLSEVLEALRLALRISSMHVIAQDLGCLTLLRYTGLYERHLLRIVWFSPSFYPDQVVPKGLRLWRGGIAGRVMNGVLRERSIRAYFRAAGSSPSPSLEAVASSALEAFDESDGSRLLNHWVHWGEPKATFWDHPRLLRKVTRPTLVIWGSDNPWIHFNQIERLGRHVEDIKTVALAGCGHFPSMDNPARVGREVAGFLGIR